ncbi:dihydrodipicolinate synthase family protein [Rhizobium sp. RM]|uniref:dihydrodipicolinate synthase family protein n=1 Tax=Rhizobium sp. RM TaxID=2748079 RepID=UPI00110F4CF7|nr:dihydrodipicolinate synthase family protein [Rhizobium sp. RM]NWJ23986.1 dihydrodipicolinate synthase family protein [Rhizobium sp. RM]TMV21435.1 dihydrodipicolinate synthase family protein [Rhizobium sp. Td3]
MTHTSFHGIIPPIVTPLNADGSVNYADLEKLVEHLIAAGVNGLFPLGSTGQVAYLTDADRIAIVEAVCRTTAGRVPVIAGAIDLTAARVAESARKLLDAGADAIVATAPIYAISDEGEIADHFRAIRSAIDAPLFAYDIPVRVHRKLSQKLLVDLGTEGVLVGVKDSSGDDVGFRRLIAMNEAAGHPLALFTGHEVVVDAMALVGADGAVPGLANVDAAAYVRLWNAAKSGDVKAAIAEQEYLNRLFEIVFCPTGRSGDAAGVGAFKAAMAAIGLLSTPTMTAPIKPLDAPVLARINTILKDVGLLK